MTDNPIESHSITTLAFDVIGTLIDFETGVREWFRPHLRDHDRDDDMAEVMAVVRRYLDRIALAHPNHTFTALLPRIYGHVARTLELDTDESAALDFRDSLRDWPAYNDVVPALRQLRDRFRLVAVTNADEWGMEAMGRTLGDPFSAAITAEAVGCTKPAPQVWEHLITTLGIDKGEILHCSASGHRDIASAHAFGLATAWIERGEDFGQHAEPAELVEPTYHVRHLDELVIRLCKPPKDTPE